MGWALDAMALLYLQVILGNPRRMLNSVIASFLRTLQLLGLPAVELSHRLVAAHLHQMRDTP
jgi:hypothetical protein